jgi:signal transduction histidine kinase
MTARSRLRPTLGVRVSMRWWLALAFALVAAIAAVAVAAVYRDRSERALLDRSRDIAVGRSVSVASAVAAEVRAGAPLTETLRARSRSSRIALFAFDRSGRLVSAPISTRVPLSAIGSREQAVAAALARERYVADAGARTVVGLPLRAGPARALLASVPRRDSAAGLAIARDAAVAAAVVAAGLGLLVGLGIAALIAARLARIAGSAAEIARGGFEKPLAPGFPDELGALAREVDRMRERLQTSFSALEAERAKLRRLLGRLQEGVVALDRRLVVRVINPAAHQMLGPEALVEGARLPIDRSPAWLRAIVPSLLEEGARPFHERIETDGRVLRVVGLPAGPADETAILVIGDLTAEAGRERAQREFVTNAAHELRTPLATICGALEVLAAGADGDPDARARFLDHARREASRLTRLTRALLVLARAQSREEAPRREAVEVGAVLRDVAAALEPREGVRVEVFCPQSLIVLGERDLIEQALANVAANSAKHTARGVIRLRGARRGRRVAIEVTDTGAGMTECARRRAFERFSRGEARAIDGFGLGLAIVREAVTAMGGEVTIDSAPGLGTRTRILLAAGGG